MGYRDFTTVLQRSVALVAALLCVSIPDARASDALFTESNGEQLQIELGCPDKKRPCAGRFNWKARGCWGSLGIPKGYERDGSLRIPELILRQGECEKRCEIVLEPGWGKYRRECNRSVVATGRFDKGRNIEIFGGYVDTSQFYSDPNGATVAAAIPPRAARLEDESQRYKETFAAIPADVRKAARTITTIKLLGLPLRDLVDAIIEADSSVWTMDSYIPGSFREITVTNVADGVVVRGNLTYSSFRRSGTWQEGYAEVKLSNNGVDCITYWNNRICSANYDVVIRPGVDRALSPDDRNCLSTQTGLKTREIPAKCVLVDPETGGCGYESDAMKSDTPFTQIVNRCNRPINAVVACSIVRQRYRIPANSVNPAPGFAMFNCQFERSFARS